MLPTKKGDVGGRKLGNDWWDKRKESGEAVCVWGGGGEGYRGWVWKVMGGWLWGFWL